MADSSSPEPQDAAAPSALTSCFDATSASHNAAASDDAASDAASDAAGADQAAVVAVTPDERATVVRRAPAPGRKPLPDAVAIHLVAVPDAAPPYDDALRGAPGGRLPGQTPRGAPGSRPPGQTPRGRRQPAASSDAAGVGRAIAAIADATRASAGRPGQGQFAGHWPSQFAQVLAETLAGSRPPSQLGPWTTQQTRRRINQLGPLLSTAHRPRVKRVIVTSPTGGVLEMTVIVGLGARVRALAVRMERTPASPADDPPDRHAAGLQPADQQGPQAAVRPGASAHPNLTGRPGWVCTAIEAA